jgi:hypothetical protein
MQGGKDLIASERGFFCILVLVACSALAILHIITGGDWLDFAKWLVVTLVASKTLTGAVETIKGSTSLTPPPSAS